MNNSLIKKTGSALLIVLLLISVAGVIIIASSKVLLSNLRIVTTSQKSIEAKQMARSGIEEGLLRYKAKDGDGRPTILINGEYGNNASQNSSSNYAAYSLTPLRRGFTDPDCQVLGNDGPIGTATYNQDCPYYDLTIRNLVQLDSSTMNSFHYTSRDLPKGEPVILNIRRSTVSSFDLVPPSGFLGSDSADIRYFLYASPDGQNEIRNENGQMSTFGRITVPSTAQSIRLKVLNKQLPDPGLTISGINGNNVLLIEKGSTTIDATGYSGSTQKKLLLTIGKDSSGNETKVLQDFSGLFSSNGIIQ